MFAGEFNDPAIVAARRSSPNLVRIEPPRGLRQNEGLVSQSSIAMPEMRQVDRFCSSEVPLTERAKNPVPEHRPLPSQPRRPSIPEETIVPSQAHSLNPSGVGQGNAQDRPFPEQPIARRSSTEISVQQIEVSLQRSSLASDSGMEHQQSIETRVDSQSGLHRESVKAVTQHLETHHRKIAMIDQHVPPAQFSSVEVPLKKKSMVPLQRARPQPTAEARTVEHEGQNRLSHSPSVEPKGAPDLSNEAQCQALGQQSRPTTAIRVKKRADAQPSNPRAQSQPLSPSPSKILSQPTMSEVLQSSSTGSQERSQPTSALLTSNRVDVFPQALHGASLQSSPRKDPAVVAVTESNLSQKSSPSHATTGWDKAPPPNRMASTKPAGALVANGPSAQPNAGRPKVAAHQQFDDGSTVSRPHSVQPKTVLVSSSRPAPTQPAPVTPAEQPGKQQPSKESASTMKEVQTAPKPAQTTSKAQKKAIKDTIVRLPQSEAHGQSSTAARSSVTQSATTTSKPTEAVPHVKQLEMELEQARRECLVLEERLKAVIHRNGNGPHR